MPAIDFYERHVISALQKAGWQIKEAPFDIRIGNRGVYVDIEASRHSEDLIEQIIIVEVKGFEGRSPVHDLEVAVGQYIVYRVLLEELGIAEPLYLAVPMVAYKGIFSDRLGQVIRERLKIKMIIVDVEIEEITQWLD